MKFIVDTRDLLRKLCPNLTEMDITHIESDLERKLNKLLYSVKEKGKDPEVELWNYLRKIIRMNIGVII